MNITAPSLINLLTSLDQRLTALTEAVEQQHKETERLTAAIKDLRNRSEWNDAQFSQVLRVIAAGMREIRETQIYGLLSEGPVTTEALRDLLQNVSRDRLQPVMVFDDDDAFAG